MLISVNVYEFNVDKMNVLFLWDKNMVTLSLRERKCLEAISLYYTYFCTLSLRTRSNVDSYVFNFIKMLCML